MELAQQLAGEGAELGTITTALNQLVGVSGGSPIGTGTGLPGAEGIAVGQYDQVMAGLAETAERRRTTELLIRNLRAEYDKATRSMGDSDVISLFEADPRVIELRQQQRQAQADRDRAARVVRRTSDPALQRHDQRIGAIEQQLILLWQQFKSGSLASDAIADGREAIRQAEAELMTLKAREATLRDRAEQLQAERIAELRQERDRLAQLHGSEHGEVVALDKRIAEVEQGQAEQGMPAHGLIASLEQSLEAVEAMRAEIQSRFEEDLTANQQAEISLLEEENLRTNLERQKAL